MLDRGVFDGTHLAMMVHPAPFDGVECNVLAIGDLTVTYTGHPAHASLAPYDGINALDALTVAQVAIGLLRQQLPPGDQIHGIIAAGGDAPNVIPEKTIARYCYRSLDPERLEALRERVVRCFEAGALATGCSVTYQSDSPPYTEFHNDSVLWDLYRKHSVAFGRFPQEMGEGGRGLGSTDMANVSRVLPAIHPMIAAAAGGAANHQAGFTAACATPSGDTAVRDGALLMALTVADVARDPGYRAAYLAATATTPSPSPEKAGTP
ncbi:MAG: peptidase dimerization domain-containing protein [Humibacillus sp.]|nr:peptidase dimerization domain-containing protein [Humibacillus sp.]MDN5776888.1 peptidase dimerization domain-containing protein [Humibacillus sp.]